MKKILFYFCGLFLLNSFGLDFGWAANKQSNTKPGGNPQNEKQRNGGKGGFSKAFALNAVNVMQVGGEAFADEAGHRKKLMFLLVPDFIEGCDHTQFSFFRNQLQKSDNVLKLIDKVCSVAAQKLTQWLASLTIIKVEDAKKGIKLEKFNKLTEEYSEIQKIVLGDPFFFFAGSGSVDKDDYSIRNLNAGSIKNIYPEIFVFPMLNGLVDVENDGIYKYQENLAYQPKNDGSYKLEGKWLENPTTQTESDAIDVELPQIKLLFEKTREIFRLVREYSVKCIINNEKDEVKNQAIVEKINELKNLQLDPLKIPVYVGVEVAKKPVLSVSKSDSSSVDFKGDSTRSEGKTKLEIRKSVRSVNKPGNETANVGVQANRVRKLRNTLIQTDEIKNDEVQKVKFKTSEVQTGEIQQVEKPKNNESVEPKISISKEERAARRFVLYGAIQLVLAGMDAFKYSKNGATFQQISFLDMILLNKEGIIAKVIENADTKELNLNLNASEKILSYEQAIDLVIKLLTILTVSDRISTEKIENICGQLRFFFTRNEVTNFVRARKGIMKHDGSILYSSSDQGTEAGPVGSIDKKLGLNFFISNVDVTNDYNWCGFIDRWINHLKKTDGKMDDLDRAINLDEKLEKLGCNVFAREALRDIQNLKNSVANETSELKPWDKSTKMNYDLIQFRMNERTVKSAPVSPIRSQNMARNRQISQTLQSKKRVDSGTQIEQETENIITDNSAPELPVQRLDMDQIENSQTPEEQIDKTDENTTTDLEEINLNRLAKFPETPKVERAKTILVSDAELNKKIDNQQRQTSPKTSKSQNNKAKTVPTTPRSKENGTSKGYKTPPIKIKNNALKIKRRGVPNFFDDYDYLNQSTSERRINNKKGSKKINS